MKENQIFIKIPITYSSQLYFIYYDQTTQCAKINSGRLEEIGSLDMTS